MNRSLRSFTRLTAVSVLTVGSVGVGSVGHADNIRTDTKLAGFAVSTEASPVLVLVDDPKAEIPRPTGTAVVEGDPNYTLASVAAGPNARAVAATLWPGNLFGEGLPQVAPGAPDYPLKAEARYPDQPYTASGVDGGQLTNATAEGLDAKATADGTPTNKPGTVTVGGVTSTSAATVDDKDNAVGTAISAVHDITLLSGVISFDDVTTRLRTSTDGKKPVASGSTTVSGLTVGGQGYTVDDKGVHAGPQSSGLPPLVTPPTLAQLGISISAITQTTTKTGNGISRVASGLVIRVDTAALRAQLAPVTGQVNPILQQLIDQAAPPQAQGNLYYLLKATPSLTFVFGAATSGAAATLPISFSFPPPAFPTGPGGYVTGPAPGGVAPGSTAVPPVLGNPGTGGQAPTVPGPAVPGPITANAASSSPAGSSAVGALLVLGALVGSGLIGWGLVRFLGLAGGGLLGGCRLGAPTSVPNLRSVTA